MRRNWRFTRGGDWRRRVSFDSLSLVMFVNDGVDM